LQLLLLLEELPPLLLSLAAHLQVLHSLPFPAMIEQLDALY
jgi:hypothetical protein